MKLRSLFLFEFKKKFRPILIFTIIWAALIFLFMSFFDSLRESAPELTKLYETMPKELLTAVGKDISQITNIHGYIGNSIMLYLMLSGTILSIFLFCSTLAGEINNKSILFLLAKPISRIKVFIAKTFAITMNFGISNIVLGVSTYLAVRLLTHDTELSESFLVLVFTNLFILELFFGGLGLLISMAFDGTKGIAIGIFAVFISYMFKILSGFTKEAEFIKYLSVNYYVDLDTLKADSTFKPEALIIIALMIAFFIASGYLFKNKDIS